MDTGQPTRRRSPQWVRAWSSTQLHAVAGKLHRQRVQADLSDRQEWLWDAIISELEYRRRRARGRERCTCWLCFGPFDLADPISGEY